MIPATGVRLGGRYELRSRLGVGGVGEVWLAHDLSLHRTVAAKVLRPELAGDDRFLHHLRTEARTTASLTHPQIAALYDYGEDDDGAGYLVMELVTGEPLSAVLAREGRLRPDVVLAVLVQATAALRAAHLAGVVHRDIKPSNILLTRDGRLKITDFGVSAGGGASTLPPRGTLVGTAHYLAPEQVLGHAAAPASDIYALGVVAYEAAVGRLPFTGRDLVAVANAHVTQELPPIPDDVPRPVADLVRQMLEKDPRRRPRSAADLAARLEVVLEEFESAGGPRPGGTDVPRGAVAAGERDPSESQLETAALPLEAPESGPGDGTRAAGGGWPWLLVATTDVIALALRLAAYRLTASVTRAGRGVDVLRVARTTTAPALRGEGNRAVGNASRRQTEVEDGSW